MVRRRCVSGSTLSRSLLFSGWYPVPLCKVPPIFRSSESSRVSMPSRISSTFSRRLGKWDNQRFLGSVRAVNSERELAIR